MENDARKLPQIVAKSLQSICKREGYLSYDLNHKTFSTDGGNFLGKLFMVTVKGNTKNGDKKLNIFIKQIISAEKLESTLDLPAAYAAEAFVYNELSEIFTEIQDEAGIPQKDRFKIIKSYEESNSELLILENVAEYGYKSCSRFYVMDLNVAEMALQQLAKFHALSFVIEKTRPDYFNKIREQSSPFCMSEKWEQSVQNVAKTTLNHLTKETKVNLQKFFPKMVASWKRYNDPKYTKCCLCHGDFRLNNLLMKETNGKVTDIITVDYQLLNYGCPINDFLFFIFLGTDREFRKKHFHHLKTFYFDSLAEFLTKFDLDIEDIYPRKQFEKDFKDRLDYGLLCALYFIPFFLADDGEVPDLGEESISDLNIKVHESFPERMQGIIDDFIEWGYL